jgi:hypothetical protein
LNAAGHLLDLFRTYAEDMLSGVAFIVPKVITVILLFCAAAGTVVHGCASADDNACVLLRIEGETNFLLLVKGADEAGLEHDLIP